VTEFFYGRPGTISIRLACDLDGDGVVDNVDMRLLRSLVVPQVQLRFGNDRETLT
jgi:hypothetical protein